MYRWPEWLFNACAFRRFHQAPDAYNCQAWPFLSGKTVYLPFALVTAATGEGIWLKCTLAELAAAPTSEAPGVELDTRAIVKVEAGNGTLALVATQPDSGELAYIVAHNLPGEHNTLLREQYVAELAPGQITVAVDPALLASFRFIAPTARFRKRLNRLSLTSAFCISTSKVLRLRVLDSVLYMNGNISSALRGELARDQVAGVSGLLEIRNNLVGDDTLAAEIARALGQDERTREQPIGVYPQLGVVRLSGSVRNAQQKRRG